MARINVMLMTFILLGFTGFKFLYFEGTTIATDDCSAGALSLTNCFIDFKGDCNENNLVEDGAVCLDIGRFSDALDINNSDCGGGFFDVAACISYLGNIILSVIVLVVSLILTLIAFIINIVLLVVIYISIGLSPIPGAPFVINFMLIGPFILGNFVLIAGFFTGD